MLKLSKLRTQLLPHQQRVVEKMQDPDRPGVKEPGMSVDEYLAQRSAEKAELNRQFRDLLPGAKTASRYDEVKRAMLRNACVKVAELAEDGEHKLQGRTNFQGLRIAIENRKGSVRSGTSPDGSKWRTEMKNPYGYIDAPAKGKDGDSIDVYLGPDKKAPTAYVVHQHKPDGKGHDEDKVMLGFGSITEARKAFLAHYDSPKFLGPISQLSVGEIRERVRKSGKIRKLAAVGTPPPTSPQATPGGYAHLYRQALVPSAGTTQALKARAPALLEASKNVTLHGFQNYQKDVTRFADEYPDVMELLRNSKLSPHMGDSQLVQNFMFNSRKGESINDTARRIGLGSGMSQADMLRRIRGDASSAQGTTTPTSSAPTVPRPGEVRTPAPTSSSAPTPVARRVPPAPVASPPAPMPATMRSPTFAPGSAGRVAPAPVAAPPKAPQLKMPGTGTMPSPAGGIGRAVSSVARPGFLSRAIGAIKKAF